MIRALPCLLAAGCVLDLSPPSLLDNPDHDFDGDGYTETDGDCSDDDASIHPGVVETCDGVDNDCNGLADDDDTGLDPNSRTAYYFDQDNDGYGDSDRLDQRCTSVDPTWVEEDGDCDDADPAIHPDAEEVCGDRIDNDCDGSSGDCGWETSNSLDDASASYVGSETSAYTGYALATCVDIVDGDGVPDILVTSPKSGRGDQGRAYVFSGAGEPTGLHDTDDAAAVLEGTDDLGWMGWDVVAFEADDEPMVALGTPGESTSTVSAGAVYLLAGTLSGTVDVTESNAYAIIEGSVPGSKTGWTVTWAADKDGAGLLMVGSRAWSQDGAEDSGALYVLDGLTTGHAEIDAAASAMLTGTHAKETLGTGTSAADDIDGDGVLDLVIGSPNREVGNEAPGGVYVLLGPVSGLHDVDDRANALLVGDLDDGHLGLNVVTGIDVDDDGTNDVLAAAEGHSGSSDDESAVDGRIYVLDRGLLGSVSGQTPIASVTSMTLDGQNDEAWGVSTAAAGDFDGDGNKDLVVGAHHYTIDDEYYGRAAVVLMPVADTGGTVLLSEQSILFDGTAGTRNAGFDVTGGCDIDDDGYDDVLVGAPNLTSDSEAGPGQAMLLYGARGL